MENSSKDHFSFAVNIALEAIKSLLLVNGGAATALIALTSKADSGIDYTWSVLFFGCGALLNCLTMILGYFSQLHYANSTMASENRNDHLVIAEHRLHVRYQYIAIIILVISLIFSSLGMVHAVIIT